MKRSMLFCFFLLFVPSLLFGIVGRKYPEILTEAPKVDDANREDVESYIKSKSLDLYLDLLSFKGDPGFKFYGFGRGGQYFVWLEEADALRDYSSQARNAYDVSASSTNVYAAPFFVFGLGQNYLTSHGEEDEISLLNKNNIDKALGREKYHHE